MKYNFDEIIDRCNTSAYKTDLLQARYGAKDLLPLWVADMDFKTPDFIMDAIRKRSEHEVLGYTVRNQNFYQPIIKWLEKKHGWKVQDDWIGFVPGIVPALAIAINALTEPGDKIIVQPPIYPPFMNVVKNNHRELIYNQLVLVDGQYRMDFEALEKAIDDKTRMILLCSPHNPGGRVWSKEELMKLADICKKNNIIVVSDEIHADMVLDGFKHYPFPAVSDAAFENSVTLIAPSKTFNMAGLISSSYIIPNSILKNKFDSYIAANEIGTGNIFAYVAGNAAYENGEDWLAQMMDYIQENIRLVKSYIEENLPKIKVIVPEASFLIWLDFRELNLTDKEIKRLLVEEAKLALNDGPSFGPGGSGFQRINIGSPRAVIEEALNRLKLVFGQL